MEINNKSNTEKQRYLSTIKHADNSELGVDGREAFVITIGLDRG
jgi:hypothetical protein